MGKPVIMADIVTRPQNSIVHQSRHSPYLPFVHGYHAEAKVMNTAINGDGFGIGWYDQFGVEPCVFKSTMPSWSCTNLQSLASHVQAHCIFAHVRAASNGSISEANCHPFKFGKMVFMQNGTVAHFSRIRVGILEEIKNTTAAMIEGMTDSEHAGALYIHFLPDHDPNKDHSGHVMKDAMLKMIKFILDLVKKEEDRLFQEEGLNTHTPSNLNFAVSDGNVVIATRYRDSRISHPPSLYFSEAKQLHLHGSDESNSQPGVEIDWHYPSGQEEVESVVVASEPLTQQPKSWMLVPRNHLLVITAHQRTIIEAIEIEGHEDNLVPEMLENPAPDIEQTKASAWDLAGKKERITGEEELREEVLNDPRNMMKVGKDRSSEEEQKKVKQELKDKAPNFTAKQRRRHSLTLPYSHAESVQTPPSILTSSGPHKIAKRLDYSPDYCQRTPASPSAAPRRSSSLPAGTLEHPGWDEPARKLDSSTFEFRKAEMEGEVDVKGKKKDEGTEERKRPDSSEKQHDGEQLRERKLKNEYNGKQQGTLAAHARTHVWDDLHISLDISKGFLMLAVVNVVCAFLWRVTC